MKRALHGYEDLAGVREWTGLAVLALPALLISIDLSVMILALPHISSSLGADSSQQLWIVDIYGFMLSGFLITMGTLGDRIGRRKLLLLGGTAFAVASLLAAFSQSAEMLIVARALLGIAGATVSPSTLALIGNMFRDHKQRSLAIGIWLMCSMGGMALGPVVGGIMLERFWWGSVFLLGVPVMLILLLIGPILLPGVIASMAGMFLSPLIARRIRPALLIGTGLLISASGCMLLTQVGVESGLTLLVIGYIFFSIGAAPLPSLSSDLVISSVPLERAGSAASILQTSGEFAFALGIAILGSIGTVVYRGQIEKSIPAGLPDSDIQAARDSLAGAIDVAKGLPDEASTALLIGAREAFTNGMHAVAVASGTMMLAVIILTVTRLRYVPPIGASQPSQVGSENQQLENCTE